jgi:cysteine sulfinate desulfinase/cysteine desulfurase-like protein
MADERVYASLRFGLGRYNTEAEIDAVVEALAGAVRAARDRSAPSA